ncbi:MAG TPA: hypothetical protein VMV21_12655 [Vicinamibacteria bacterium]|nr:hypothetical protein [Vicinamibacteria bacterium]
MNLAFVLPRYGPEGEGGAERARDLGSRLVAQGHSLEIWSTAALDPVTWENVLDTGTTEEEGITVRRFSVTSAEEAEVPLVSGLLEHVRRHRRELDVAVFFSSPAWAETHGLLLAPEGSVLVARGGRHRMPPGGCGARVVFDTPEEQAAEEAVAEGPRPRSEVIGSGVDLGVEPARTEAPEALKGLGRYVVLVAPLEARDGCAVTVDSFLRAEREGRMPVTLVLIGRGRISLGENVHVRQLGDLSGTAQDQATRGSLAVLVPSRLEVVAPSALRAWRVGRPVIAHGPSHVMRGVVARANGGVSCATGEELAAALELLAAEPALADVLGRQGRAHLEAHHAWPVVLQKWESLLRRVASRGAAAA